MSLLQKSCPLRLGMNDVMGPQSHPLKYLKFARLLLADDLTRYEEVTGGDEVVISILCGTCSLHVDGEEAWQDLGGRESMLDGTPDMVYVPRHRRWRIDKTGEALHAAVFRAPARRDTAPALVRSGDVPVVTFGSDSWQRHAVLAVTENVDADRLLVGETYNLPGCWSSYPPHKHDAVKPPKEAWYEEVYHYAVHPAQGFGIQRVYTAGDDPDPLDEVYVVEDGDTVALPRGYHPVVAGGGYRLGYLWALAGEERSFGAWSEDARHAWLAEAAGRVCKRRRR